MTVKNLCPLKADASAPRIRKPERKARKKTEVWRLNNQEAQKRFRKKQKVRSASSARAGAGFPSSVSQGGCGVFCGVCRGMAESLKQAAAGPQGPDAQSTPSAEDALMAHAPQSDAVCDVSTGKAASQGGAADQPAGASAGPSAQAAQP